ncbi:MAG TPA: DUF4226 domain-containing protein [Mycobacterium sp.]|nr:MAG: DUF4226 domain-containing protein [Mycobacterium sp.]HOB48769.1 DUF4226 domain-containing protein [Mycobacterium sp.]HPZ95171.1 DUF4226 domain-containing protein [Mycobacterium sp.]HQE14364.1 DUF4226 domain-containing protein [Mycobacterium sp.]
MPEETQETVTSARAALAATAARVAAADRLLVETVRDAHRMAVESRERLAAIRAEIDAAVARRSVATPAAGADFARFLLAKNREIAEIVAEARADAESKAVALQELATEYRSAAAP